jgi:copper(I)-binding protein
MLLGLKEPLRPGQSIPLTLQFEKAGTEQVTVTVRDSAAASEGAAGSAGMQIPMPAQR